MASSKKTLPFLLAGAFVLLFVSAVGVTMLAQQPASNSAATAIGGPFRLHNGAGKTVTEADLRGTPFLVFFGYTHCPDVCPLTLAKITQVLKELGPDARVKVLFVTVDPERDTPDRMAEYAANFDARVIGLSGDRAEVDAMLAAYQIYARKVPTPSGDYTMDHSAVVYLMDREGHFVRGVNLDRPTDQVAKDLRATL